MEEVVNEKIQIDVADNPAKKFILKKDLANRRIKLFDVTVKDVTSSNNIEYELLCEGRCADKKGLVECNIYSTNVKNRGQAG